MAKATQISSSTSTLTQSPGGEVLTSLVRRLRSGAKAIANPAAKRTLGKDMVAAADVIEQLLADMPVEIAAAVAMVALIGRTGYASYVGGRQ